MKPWREATALCALALVPLLGGCGNDAGTTATVDPCADVRAAVKAQQAAADKILQVYEVAKQTGSALYEGSYQSPELILKVAAIPVITKVAWLQVGKPECFPPQDVADARAWLDSH